MTSSTGGVSRDVITLSRDAYGYVAVYTCNVGSVFVEGGHVRTSVCTDGQWRPASVAGCHGNQRAYLVTVYQNIRNFC